MMQVTGFYTDARLSLDGKLEMTVSINEKADAIRQINEMSKETLMDIEIKPHREKRSLNANGLLWHCIGQIAKQKQEDKWTTYLHLLKDYGEYTYILVTPKAVEAVKKSWRESEVIGEVDVNGRKAVQMLCYYGSSTYDTKQFSNLLESVISDMKDLGLQPPLPQDIKRSLEQWEHMHQTDTNRS